MGKQRLEAFTDGVVAIIITIMVLELKVPAQPTLASLKTEMPLLLAYALSFTNVGVFWNNHHHMLHATERINGTVLWANLALLFALSLVPFVIRWMDETHYAPVPTAAYGAVLLMAGIAYLLLEKALIKCNGPKSKLAQAIGNEAKGKLSMAGYASAIPLAFVGPWISIVVYVAIALMWFVPDRRIESLF
jgi:uncharacterized membrane protein